MGCLNGMWGVSEGQEQEQQEQEPPPKFSKGYSQKKNSIFKDIIQIGVDLPPSQPIFDKFIFDKVLIMLTSLPPL